MLLCTRATKEAKRSLKKDTRCRTFGVHTSCLLCHNLRRLHLLVGGGRLPWGGGGLGLWRCGAESESISEYAESHFPFQSHRPPPPQLLGCGLPGLIVRRRVVNLLENGFGKWNAPLSPRLRLWPSITSSAPPPLHDSRVSLGKGTRSPVVALTH